MADTHRIRWTTLGLTLGLLGSSPGALAHTLSAYLMPEAFDLKNPTVTVQSALTVEKFYEPSRSFAAHYQWVGPDGQTSTPVPVAELKRYSILELDVPQPGTYRLQASSREPQLTQCAQVDGQWLRIRPSRAQETTPPRSEPATRAPAASPAQSQPRRFITADQVPASAARATSQLIQQAELYVSRGAPSALPAARGQGFELVPLTAPNDVYVDSGFEFRLQQDGQPLTGVPVEVFRGSDGLDPQAARGSQTVTTDAQGRARVNFAQPGVYLLTTRHPQEAAQGSRPPAARSVQYSLSLQVAP